MVPILHSKSQIHSSQKLGTESGKHKDAGSRGYRDRATMRLHVFRSGDVCGPSGEKLAVITETQDKEFVLLRFLLGNDATHIIDIALLYLIVDTF